jgi:LCP family protein required for cell wall assembly
MLEFFAHMFASTPDPSVAEGLKPGLFGPVEAFGKPRNGGIDWGRTVAVVFTSVLALAVLTGGTYVGLVWYELRQVGTNAVNIDDAGTFAPSTEGDDALAVPEVEPVEDRTTILLVGSDSREGLTEQQLLDIGTETTPNDLTDTIILLQVDPATDAAAMLSFPRDMVVERCDGSRGRINEAFYIGELQGEGLGPKCLVDTLTAFARIDIDHYVRVNFAGFVSAVDALGGVTFYLDNPIADRSSGLDVPEGCVEFDGVKALQFVRARKIDSDFGRIARQQRFAREMLNKATSLGTLVNPTRVASLIGSISEVLETDEDFGGRQMVDLLNSVRSISSGAVDARTVPGVLGRLGPQNASVVYPVEDQAEALFQSFRAGDLLPEGVGTDAEPLALGPTNVIPILVDNGSERDGLGEETAEVLGSLGYTVSETGTAENYSFDASLILYPADRKDQALVLSESLGGVAINQGGGDVDELTLILGGSFDPEAFRPEPADEVIASPATPVPDATESEFTGAALSAVQC